jgi:hypothetical protein
LRVSCVEGIKFFGVVSFRSLLNTARFVESETESLKSGRSDEFVKKSPKMWPSLFLLKVDMYINSAAEKEAPKFGLLL